MIKRQLMVSAVALSLTASQVFAAGDAPAGNGVQVQKKTQERIYGSQLMTRKERMEYRGRMRAAKSAEERERIRNEHHELMQERARERGVSLPERPPARGGGMGPGGGMGRRNR